MQNAKLRWFDNVILAILANAPQSDREAHRAVNWILFRRRAVERLRDRASSGDENAAVLLSQSGRGLSDPVDSLEHGIFRHALAKIASDTSTKAQGEVKSKGAPWNEVVDAIIQKLEAQAPTTETSIQLEQYREVARARTWEEFVALARTNHVAAIFVSILARTKSQMDDVSALLTEGVDDIGAYIVADNHAQAGRVSEALRVIAVHGVDHRPG